jgi:hypothetical protein
MKTKLAHTAATRLSGISGVRGNGKEGDWVGKE